MITAGRKNEVYWGEGNWIILDIGFANNRRSCGIAIADESPRVLFFGEARKEIVDAVMQQSGTTNLVIEAPLSVCFDVNRNPKGRKIEKRDSKTRYWYNGLGCAVMTAAMYLIRDIHEATKNKPCADVRLFEGFVSFKEDVSDHNRDVLALREVVMNSLKHQTSIYSANELKFCESDEIRSAFCVAGLDCGVPAVIAPPLH